MGYRIIITETAEGHVDKILNYLIYRLKNPSAAQHFLEQISLVYDQLEVNPFIYKLCNDPYLNQLNYHEALLKKMNYRIIFSVENHQVFILGVFHQLENHPNKLL